VRGEWKHPYPPGLLLPFGAYSGFQAAGEITNQHKNQSFQIMIMEKQGDNSTKKIVVQAIIDKIEKEGQVNEIKTQIVEGYNQPEMVAKKSSDQEGYTPDVIAVHAGSNDLYEVELDADNIVLEKWQIFSLYSKKSNGSFSIVTPKDNLEKVRNLLKSNQIHAKLIYFS
jgi:hypothetical protein